MGAYYNQFTASTVKLQSTVNRLWNIQQSARTFKSLASEVSNIYNAIKM